VRDVEPFADNDFCFACGTKNPLGMQLTFMVASLPGGEQTLCTRLTPSPHWQGFQGVMHGGLQATVMDDLMSNHLFRLERVWVATVELTLRFRHPVPMGGELLFRSRVAGHEGRTWRMRCECLPADVDRAQLLTTAEGRFVEV